MEKKIIISIERETLVGKGQRCNKGKVRNTKRRKKVKKNKRGRRLSWEEVKGKMK